MAPDLDPPDPALRMDDGNTVFSDCDSYANQRVTLRDEPLFHFEIIREGKAEQVIISPLLDAYRPTCLGHGAVELTRRHLPDVPVAVKLATSHFIDMLDEHELPIVHDATAA